jgi:Family of unknown function (DUF6272)
MLARELFDIRSMLRKQGIIFAYSGYMTEAVLAGVGEAVKQKLSIEDADTRTIRSVFAVFVEQMQNIIRYSAERTPEGAYPEGSPLKEMRYGILTIGSENGDYVIYAGNLIERAEVGKLREKLKRIRGMSKDELRALYKEQLRSEPDAASKGAGVGLTEIARRASKPIEFDFHDVDEKYAFFALKASV